MFFYQNYDFRQFVILSTIGILFERFEILKLNLKNKKYDNW